MVWGLVERTEGVESIHGFPLYVVTVLIFAGSKVHSSTHKRSSSATEQGIGDSEQLAYDFQKGTRPLIMHSKNVQKNAMVYT